MCGHDRPVPASPPTPSRYGPAAVRTAALAVAAAVVLAGCGATTALEDGPGRHGEDATEIVLLGTSHFAGSASDERTSEVSDVLSESRQRELDAVARRIADWAPDRFLVECRPSGQSVLDSLYRAYRTGAYDPTEAGDRREIRQLGFRAADASGLDGLGCVSADGLWLGSRARQVAEEHDPEVLERYRRHVERSFDRDSLLAALTLREYLRELNTEEQLWKNHAIYVYHYARMGSFEGSGTKVRRESDLAGSTFAAAFDVAERHMERFRRAVERVGGQVVDSVGPDTDYVVVLDREEAGTESGPGTGADTLSVRDLGSLIQRTSTTWVGFPDHHIGADLVGEWYKRNLRIYANVWRAVQEGDDRVLLMIGQGHVWTLRQFFRENPDFEVVPVDELL